MSYHPWARYPSYSYDDMYVRPQPVVPPPHASPRQTCFEDDYWSARRGPPAWPGMAPAYLTPTGYATMVPLPPSPYGTPRHSPRMGYVPLAPVATPIYPHYLQADPYYIPAVPLPYPPPAPTPRAQLHPLLNGEAPTLDLIFDLSASTVRPLAPSGPHPGTHVSTLSNKPPPPIPVHRTYLAQTATYPPTSRLTLHCGALHPYADDWPITVKKRRPITVSDVLDAIHASLQTQITHVEWARLSEGQVREVSRAYTRRCRSADSFASAADFERNQGVRRVDFLREQYMFAGLIRMKADDVENFRMSVTEKKD